MPGKEQAIGAKDCQYCSNTSTKFIISNGFYTNVRNELLAKV